MQTSQVFSQRTYPGIKPDIDDCWAVSGIQLVNVSYPWLTLPTVKRFRAEANNPDHPGVPDGGNLLDIEQGIRGCWPALSDFSTFQRTPGLDWQEFKNKVRAGHPASVSVDSSKLPVDLRFRFTGLHQVTFAYKNGQLLYANPLANDRSRWLKITMSMVRAAILSYGHMRRGHDCVYAVFGPTDTTARTQLCGPVAPPDDTPFDQADIDAATAALQAKIDAAMATLGAED